LAVSGGGRSRLQLCGRFVLEIEGRQRDQDLPGRQGRLLLAYLALNGGRAVDRDEVTEALWPGIVPPTAPSALRVLVSKLRAVLGPDWLPARTELTLLLPPTVRVDVHAALDAVHRAESAVALREWARAWGPALLASFVSSRRLLPGCEAPWIDDWRRRLDEVLDRALECYATSCLRLGGTELPGAERAARRLVAHAPFRESGYRLLMEALEARGDVAEALRVHEQLLRLLREELGTVPGPAIQEVYRRLLAAT
jgi:DNA-binding SARP family transcriptional activator